MKNDKLRKIRLMFYDTKRFNEVGVTIFDLIHEAKLSVQEKAELLKSNWLRGKFPMLHL